MTPCINRRCCQ